MPYTNFKKDLLTMGQELPDIQNILIDMDGVVIDDVAMYAKLCPEITDMEAYLQYLQLTGKRQSFVFPLIEKAIETEAFATAPYTAFLLSLHSRLLEQWKEKGIEVKILTSTMSVNPKRKELEKQKLQSLELIGLGHLPVIFAEGSAQKQNYATPNTLLIDDYDRTITQFRSKGGVAIQYTGLAKTLEQLEMLGLYQHLETDF